MRNEHERKLQLLKTEPTLKMIRKDIERAPDVRLIGIQYGYHLDEPYEGLWEETIDLFVAPSSQLYSIDSLRLMLTTLVTSVRRSHWRPFSTLPGVLNYGHNLYDDSRPHHEGDRETQRAIFVRIFPNCKIARAVKDGILSKECILSLEMDIFKVE